MYVPDRREKPGFTVSLNLSIASAVTADESTVSRSSTVLASIIHLTVFEENEFDSTRTFAEQER